MSHHVYFAKQAKQYRVAVLKAPDEKAPKRAKHVEVHDNGKGWAELPKAVMLGIVGLDRLDTIAGGEEFTSGHASVRFVPGADEVYDASVRKNNVRTFDQKLATVKDMGIAIAERPEFKDGGKQARAFALLKANMTTHDWINAMGEEPSLQQPKPFNGIGFVKHCLAAGYVRRKG